MSQETRDYCNLGMQEPWQLANSSVYPQVAKSTGPKSVLALPRVTAVLGVIDKGPGLARWIANIGWNESQRVLHEAGERGTRIHEWIHREASKTEGRLVLDVHDQEIGPKRAFMVLRRRILSCYRICEQRAEVSVSCGECGYRGTLDAFFHLLDRRGRHRYVLADWKTSKAVRPEWALQTAAYVHALVRGQLVPDLPRGERSVFRWGFRFGADGSLESVFYPDFLGDFFAFKCALGVYKWKQQNKRLASH